MIKIRDSFIWKWTRAVYIMFIDLIQMAKKTMRKEKNQCMDYIYELKYSIEKKCYKDIKFYSYEESFALLESGKSLCRYGDGEIGWMYGIHHYNAFHQMNSPELSEALKKVFFTRDERIMIAVPNVFGSLDFLEEKYIAFNKRALGQYGKKWMSILSQDYKYVDSRITRIYGDVKYKKNASRWFEQWKNIWKDKKIIIVEGEYTRFGVNNDLLNSARTVQRIICPAENAFSVYHKIYKVAEKYVKKCDLFLIALGPTATILAYDLARNGTQAIDIGHLDIEYEWFKHKTEGKGIVIGKYVNESNQSSEDYKNLSAYDSSAVEMYRKSIIERVKIDE